MNIRTVIRKRKLTNFNSSKLVNGKKFDHYSVLLYVRDRGKSYYISTKFVTSNINMVGCEFMDADCTKIVNKLKTTRLMELISECEEYALRNPDKSVENLKVGLTALVQGKDESEVEQVGKKVKTLVDYMEEFCSSRPTEGTKSVYRIAINKVRKFDDKVTLDGVTINWLDRFVDYCKETGGNMNSNSIKLRCIKATINWAIRYEWTDNNVFRRYQIKQEKTTHLVLTWQELADFRDYPCEPWQEVYRDMAMLSFYLCGINTCDLMQLTKLVRGRCVYDRQKTGSHGDVTVIDEAKAIMDKYKGEDCMLSVMDGRSSYSSFASSWNVALKKIGWHRIVKDKVGKLRKIDYHPMFEDLTTYTFRRTFATLASDLDIPKETIGQCLTHSWTDVTERYITRSSKKVDECVRKVVDHLNTFKGRSKDVIDAEIRERDGIA